MIVRKLVIAAARRAKKPVVVDPKGSNYGRYRGASVATPNRAELAEAAGHTFDDDAALVATAQALIKDAGLGGLIVTRSDEGMSVLGTDGSHHHLAADKREVADVTGAGDTVVAVLALALAGGAPLIDAARNIFDAEELTPQS